MRPSPLYESFNARNLTPEEIARTFVVPDDFALLCGNNHSVLMGPRGSGKTTMLKMLTAPALSSWLGDEAERFREAIQFIAVYVPTDIHWHHQLFHSSKKLREFPDLERKFTEAAITTNFLAALCTTFADRIRYHGLEDNEKEGELCRSLIRVWRLPPTLPLLATINEELGARLNDLYVTVDCALRKGSPEQALGALPEHFSLDYLAAGGFACIAFDRLFCSEKPQKWALCFDELELAPEWLQDRLFAELRSSDERFLFKLSTSPIPKLSGIHQSGHRQDFSVIRLWPHRKRSPREFCERLISSIVTRHFGEAVRLDDLFGDSPTPFKADESEYARGSLAWETFKDLATLDEHFRHILEKNDLSPVDPYTNDISKRDRVLRKAKPLALQRLSFMKKDKLGRPVRRSRKISAIYHGKDVIIDVTDGNPRWLYGIVTNMLAKAQLDVRGHVKVIPKTVQASVIKEAAGQFRGFLESVPESMVSVGSFRLDLTTLLASLGECFFRSIVADEFTLDPIGSFKVDKQVPSELIPLIRLAAYHGAIVLVEPTEGQFDVDPRGRRFRLSHLLAPEFKIPLRLYKATTLSRCLGSRFAPAKDGSRQRALPFGVGHEA